MASYGYSTITENKDYLIISPNQYFLNKKIYKIEISLLVLINNSMCGMYNIILTVIDKKINYRIDKIISEDELDYFFEENCINFKMEEIDSGSNKFIISLNSIKSCFMKAEATMSMSEF